MGLVKPTSGSIEIDNQLLEDKNISSWQSFIGHVPQSILCLIKT